MPTSPHIEPDNLKQSGRYYAAAEFQKNISSPQIEKNEILKDVMIDPASG